MTTLRIELLIIFSFLNFGYAGSEGTSQNKSIERARYWEKFPQPPGRATNVLSLGEDRQGGLWAMCGQGTYYWNAPEKLWSKPVLGSGQYLTGLYGGRDIALYATQRGSVEHWGKVYSLGWGRADYVTDFYYDVPHHYPGFYVSKDGRLFNWGGEKLRIFEQGEWIECPADLPQKGTLVFDAGEIVSLFSKGHLYVVDQDTRVKDVEVNVVGVTGVLLGDDTVIMLEYGVPGVSAFDLSSGRIVNSDSIDRVLGERALYDLFSSPNGDVWIRAMDHQLRSYVLFRIRPDGTTTMIQETAGLPWGNQFFGFPQGIAVEADETIWFARYGDDICTLNGTEVKQFDHRIDHGPYFCRRLMKDRNGVMYAGSANGLYAYHNGVPLTNEPRMDTLPPLASLSTPVWKYSAPQHEKIEMAWQVNDLVLFIFHRGKELIALHAKSGEQAFSIPLSQYDAGQAWVSAGGGGKIVVALKDRILTVDSLTGEILYTLKHKRDQHIGAILDGDDYIFSVQNRGGSLSRISHSGTNVWTCVLPGTLVSHPISFGSVLLVQTRGGSYGGHRSLGVDIKSGEQLWSDQTDAYGRGFAFADDARYCVEAGCYLAPDATEAWLIARNPRTGERLWHYRCEGTMASQVPVIKKDANLVYSVFENGTVVCLDGIKGEPVWEKQLPCRPRMAPAASYDPYHPCIGLYGDRLIVATDDHMLYILDAYDGHVMHRILATEDVIKHGKRAGTIPIVAGPWIWKERLLIPSQKSITYQFIPVHGVQKCMGSGH